MRCVPLSIAVLTLCTVTQAADPPFPITNVLQEGDLIPGAGAVNAIWARLDVNDAGDWATVVRVPGNDYVLLRSGQIVLKKGDPVSSPFGATVDTIGELAMDNSGRIGWTGALATPLVLDVLAVEDQTLIVEGDISISPDMVPPTAYTGFPPAMSMNDVGQIFTAPELAGLNAGMRYQFDEAGTLVSETLLVHQGLLAPGQTESVLDVSGGSGINDAGRTLFLVTLDAPIWKDRVVYLDEQEVAQEGDLSPIPGQYYDQIYSALAVNDHDDTVFVGRHNGPTISNTILIKNGEKFVQEGDVLPDIAPDALEDTHADNGAISGGMIDLDDHGNVLWYGRWELGATTVEKKGLFLNDVLLTPTDPGEFFSVSKTALSDNGRFVLYRANVTGNVSVLHRIDITPPSPAPDGFRIPGAQALAGLAPNGTNVEVTWDTTGCPASGYHLVYGSLSSVSEPEYTGAACDLGTNGSATFTPPEGDLFWIVVGSDAAGRESSHGFTSTGKPREAASDGLCGAEQQIRTSSCPI